MLSKTGDNPLSNERDEPIIRCEGIWKVFGEAAADAMQAISNEGLSNDEVRRRYECVVAVRDASFSVARGEIFCIMGLSGSGKSTLIRHINRLIEPTTGSIFIEDRDVNAMSQKELRALRAEKIGMVFQNVALLPHRTVRDNVAFSLEVRGAPDTQRAAVAKRAIEAVDLAGWDHMYPDELSGGMQQRVGLARAIAADPAILLMDEPFSALDPLIRRQLQTTFMELSARLKKTTVFITHDLDEAIRIGDRIAIMKDGVLVQTGTPEEIVTRPADDYVADFVAGISRLELVTASRVMQPFQEWRHGNNARNTTHWPIASPDDKLDKLIDLAVDAEHPIIVQANGVNIGVITKKTLLRGIQGREQLPQVDQENV